MAIFKGAGVAIVTPMKDNGEINYEVLGALIEDQIANHTDAIIICGTSGETMSISRPSAIQLRKQLAGSLSSRVRDRTIPHTRS